MRENLMRALQDNYAGALHQEALGQWRAGDSKDAIEGGLSFLQKRKPEFRGA